MFSVSHYMNLKLVYVRTQTRCRHGREKRRRERIERGILIGLDISLTVDASYRFPHSEIEAIGTALEERRQLYYRAPNPSCSFYVITEEAYCCLRGFVRYLGHLP